MPNSSCSPHGRTLRLTAILLVAVSICLVAEAAEDPLALLARLDKQETQELKHLNMASKSCAVASKVKVRSTDRDKVAEVSHTCFRWGMDAVSRTLTYPPVLSHTASEFAPSAPRQSLACARLALRSDGSPPALACNLFERSLPSLCVRGAQPIGNFGNSSGDGTRACAETGGRAFCSDGHIASQNVFSSFCDGYGYG